MVAWRVRAKKRLVDAFGGACGLCGYNKCHSALAFHHIDPKEKENSFGQIQSMAWEKIINEVRKCVMLCHNCHAEFHAGVKHDLSKCPRFNEFYATYKRGNYLVGSEVQPPKPRAYCKKCGKEIVSKRKLFCSEACYAIFRTKEIISEDELYRAFLKHGTKHKVARHLKVANRTLRRWVDFYDKNSPAWRKDHIPKRAKFTSNNSAPFV